MCVQQVDPRHWQSFHNTVKSLHLGATVVHKLQKGKGTKAVLLREKADLIVKRVRCVYLSDVWCDGGVHPNTLRDKLVNNRKEAMAGWPEIEQFLASDQCLVDVYEDEVTAGVYVCCNVP